MNWRSRAIQLKKKSEGTSFKILGKMGDVCSVVTSILMVVIVCQANFILEKQNAYMVAVSNPFFVNESPVENENGVLFNFTQVDGYADNLQGNAYDAVFIDVYPEYGDRDQTKTIELNIYGLYDSSLELYSDKPRVVVSEEKSALSRKEIIGDCINRLLDEGVLTDSFTEWRKMSISYENIEGEHESKQYFIQPFEDSDYFLSEAYFSMENRENPIYVFDYYVEISSEEEIQHSIEEIKSLVN